MRHIGNFIVSMLSLLPPSPGSHKGGGQRAAGTDPFSLGREMMTCRSERERRRETPLLGHMLEEGMTATAESSVSKTMKAKFTRDRTAAQLQRTGAAGNT